MWFGADLPLKMSASVTLSTDREPSWRAEGSEPAITDTAFDTVWYRRHNLPFVDDRIHPDDREFAARELRMFDRTIWTSIAPEAFWVNPVERYDSANNKLLQMKTARAIGFAVPETLMSNDPGDIREFVARHEGEPGVIYKSFFPSRWELAHGGRAFLPTTQITRDALPEHEVLRLTPGIFQAKIAKAYEIRVTVMGRETVAIKIDTPENTQARQDWRFDPERTATFSHIELSPHIREKCLGVMDRLGLVFGCFDLIVTPEDETVFLEVNEMGQFLWQESALAQLPLLDMFCRFLAEGRADFRYDPDREPLAFPEIRAADWFEAALANSEQNHISRFARRPSTSPPPRTAPENPRR